MRGCVVLTGWERLARSGTWMSGHGASCETLWIVRRCLCLLGIPTPDAALGVLKRQRVNVVDGEVLHLSHTVTHEMSTRQ